MVSLRLLCLSSMLWFLFQPYAAGNPATLSCPEPSTTSYTACPGCCANMGGIHYCDASAGRFVCHNGYYSSCYCDRHAVMDLEKIRGCCLWQGGVLSTEDSGLVICNNGGISETCSVQNILP